MHFPALFHTGEDDLAIQQGKMYRCQLLRQVERLSQAVHRGIRRPGFQVGVIETGLSVRDVRQPVFKVLECEKGVEAEKRVGKATI